MRKVLRAFDDNLFHDVAEGVIVFQQEKPRLKRPRAGLVVVGLRLEIL
jgi:hypothetical protein